MVAATLMPRRHFAAEPLRCRIADAGRWIDAAEAAMAATHCH